MHFILWGDNLEGREGEWQRRSQGRMLLYRFFPRFSGSRAVSMDWLRPTSFRRCWYKNQQSRIRFRTQDTLPSSPCGGLTSYSSDSKKFESAWSLTKWDSKVVILMGLKDMEDMVSDRRSKEERRLNWNWIDVLTWRWSGACEVGAEKWVTEFLLFNICI